MLILLKTTCIILLDFQDGLRHNFGRMMSPFRLALLTGVSALAAMTFLPPMAQAQAVEPSYAAPQADVITGIRVEGNQRVDASTIRTYLGVREGSAFEASAIDEGLKKLFATGFFSDVKLLREGNDLIVRVVENPVISRVVLEGNDRIDSSDLEKELELQPRSVYTRAKVQADVKRMLDIYRRSGRYSAKVVPKLVALEQNRVDLVYEIDEGPVSRVQQVTFLGNDAFSSSELREVVLTAETAWWKFLTDNDKYDPEKLQYDQELLRRYYTSQGYADFKVKTAHAELSPSKDGFFLTFVLDEGPQYTLANVDVENELQDRTTLPDFSQAIITESGDTYDSAQIQESVDAMTAELGNLGYAFVDILPRLTRDLDKNTIDLTYLVKPGPRVYVERIDIKGNARTLDEVIRREFRVAEGDPYNTAKLARTEQRLNNLGFFEKVEITTEEGTAPDKTVVDVEVQEKSTGEINVGAGFSSSDGALADFGIKETNLLGRGQELRTRFTVAARRKQAEIGFTEPYFLNRELAAGFDIYRTQLDYQSESSYDINSQGISLRLGYALRERLNHSVFYSYRSNDITDVQPFASRFIRDQEGKTINSSIGHALTYDDRNNKFDPSNGYYFRASQEFAGLGGDSKYAKHEVRTAYYHPWAKNWIFSVGGSGGHILSLGEDILISDRFFIGGETVRGFDNLGIGARDTLTRDSLGSNIYYAATMEQRFPLGLPEDLGMLGAVFIDMGSAWDVDDNGPEVADSNKLRIAAGVGISWQSPFGPIRLDLAKPITKQEFDEEELFRFSFGTRF